MLVEEAVRLAAPLSAPPSEQLFQIDTIALPQQLAELDAEKSDGEMYSCLGCATSYSACCLYCRGGH